jgi:hypothetical protein
MSTNNIVGWIIGIILILLFFYYFYATNPWRDLKADAEAAETTARAAAAVGGAYLLRKYMKNKKSHKKRK